MVKGRVAVMKEYGKPFELQEYEVPDPEPGAMVLRMTQSGICGSDLHNWRADLVKPPIPPQGLSIGHEGAGVVYRMGEGVTADTLGAPIQEGDRVIHSGIVPCNGCRLCFSGRANLCTNRSGFMFKIGDFPYFRGTFADYYYVRPGQPIFKVPDQLPDDVLGSVNCGLGTATGGVVTAGTGQGDYVVIFGAGGIGLTATAMSKDKGADRVIVLDKVDARLRLAEEFGADFTVNVEEYNTPETRIKRVWELTDGRGADVAMEFVGLPTILPEGVAMLTNGGTFVEVGLSFSGGTVPFDPSTIVRSGKRILGSVMYQPLLLTTILDFLVRNQDRRPFSKMMARKFKLADINEAFAVCDTQQSEVIRGVIVP